MFLHLILILYSVVDEIAITCTSSNWNKVVEAVQLRNLREDMTQLEIIGEPMFNDVDDDDDEWTTAVAMTTTSVIN